LPSDQGTVLEWFDCGDIALCEGRFVAVQWRFWWNWR
jgi:hypothetical protein